MKKEIKKAETTSNKTILVGAMVGAGAGLIAAMLLRRRAKKKKREHTITVAEGLRIGLIVFGLLRAIASLNDNDDE
jgi:gas vesicle protein